MSVANVLAQVITTSPAERSVIGIQATSQIPPAEHITVDEIIVCNRGAATTFRISITIGGGLTTAQDYLYYDTPIAANDTFAAEIGVTLTGRDTLRGQSPGTVTFTVIGGKT